MRGIERLSDIAAFYEGFIIDLWGVVHNGVAPFPDAVPALMEMKRAHRKVFLLSNAPRRAHMVAARLTEMGVPETVYDGIVTSGEATFIALRDTYLEKWGRNLFHLGPARDNSLYDTLDVNIVSDLANADFILNTGVYDFADREDTYTAMLADAARHGVKMLCANPDQIVHVGDQLVYCAGRLATIYAGMEGAGEIAYLGKPYREVYGMCFDGMGTRKVLAIGDGMPTDIQGAYGTGLDSALVTAGIHRDHFNGNTPSTQTAQGLFDSYVFKPTYLIEKLKW